MVQIFGGEGGVEREKFCYQVFLQISLVSFSYKKILAYQNIGKRNFRVLSSFFMAQQIFSVVYAYSKKKPIKNYKMNQQQQNSQADESAFVPSLHQLLPKATFCRYISYSPNDLADELVQPVTALSPKRSVGVKKIVQACVL